VHQAAIFGTGQKHPHEEPTLAGFSRKIPEEFSKRYFLSKEGKWFGASARSRFCPEGEKTAAPFYSDSGSGPHPNRQPAGPSAPPAEEIRRLCIVALISP
jgi:hypothetical protein